jgi:hypothetical protein
LPDSTFSSYASCFNRAIVAIRTDAGTTENIGYC